MRAKITRRARTVTEGPPVTDPFGAATQSLRAKNCLPMVVEHKSDIRLRPFIALQTILLHGNDC